MVRHYKKVPGTRSYRNYSVEDLRNALDSIQSGMSVQRAAIVYKIPRITLRNKSLGVHNRSVGHPSVLTSGEQEVIRNTLLQVAKWGFPLTKCDIRAVVKKFLDKQGKTVREFKDNYPGPDFVENFIKKHNLSIRIATNIKQSRSSVDRADIIQFFENIKDALGDVDNKNLYNYDETNIADDPGAKKVIVPRNFRRVERVQNYSRSCVSIMVCGNAAGDLLPPMVVYKSSNLYENWCTGGPPGTVYGNSPSGWFDMNLFEQWFFKSLLPHIKATKESETRAVVVGDNLASHFSPQVIKAALENNIYMCPFPANATHLMQPLDVAVFAPFKRKWREILEKWRKESRYSGTLPKEHFPALLSLLWNRVSETVETNLKSGFRTTGLYPMNFDEVLRKIPGVLPENLEETERVLDSSLVEFFKEMRGTSEDQKKRKRGKKFEAGKQMTIEDQAIPSVQIENEVESQPQTIPDNSDEELPCFSDNHPGPSGIPSKKVTGKAKKPKVRPPISITKASLRGKSELNSKCAICRMPFKNYRGRADWIECVQCKKWICGLCNSESTDPFYVCPVCEDSDDEPQEPFADNSDEDRTFNPETEAEKDRKLKKFKFNI